MKGSACVHLQDTKELSFEDNLAAATGTGQGDEAALELGLRQAAATTLAARQRRRSLLADIALCTSMDCQ